MMRPFVALQVAFSLVVLFVGGLLVLSFARLSHVNPGFAASDVLLVSVAPVQRMPPQAHRTAMLRIVERLRGVPGVQAVSSAEFNVIGRAWTNDVRVPGTQYDTIEVTMAPVSPGFFETMGIPLLAGRAFVDRDMDLATATAMIVNESFARRYFAGEPPVGRTFEARFGEADTTRLREVVGVVADARYDLRKPAAPTIYIPLTLRTSSTVLVRVARDQATLIPRLREEIRAADGGFRVTSLTPQSAVVDQTLLRERLLALISGFFAIVGLVLVALGLYGVLSYSVVQRTREIGIRVALGAGQIRVVRTVLADAAGPGLAGAAFGMAGALYLSRFVEALLFEVTPRDFWSLAMPLGLLALAGLLAAVLPAFRVARIDPAVALRYE
jgi:predicted permease